MLERTEWITTTRPIAKYVGSWANKCGADVGPCESDAEAQVVTLAAGLMAEYYYDTACTIVGGYSLPTMGAHNINYFDSGGAHYAYDSPTTVFTVSVARPRCGLLLADNSGSSSPSWDLTYNIADGYWEVAGI